MKLMLELSDQAYEIVHALAEAEGLTVEVYLTRAIEGGRLQGEEAFRRFMIMELKGLLEKIEQRKGYFKNNNKQRGLRFIAHNQIKKGVPPEIEKMIKDYQKRDWLEGDHFYLIMEENRLAGYAGFSSHSEAMPYGSYLFIYDLYVMPAYQHKAGLTQLAAALQALVKKNAYQCIDISSLSTNLEEHHLSLMGFLPFEQTVVLKGTIQPGKTAIKPNALKKVSLPKNWMAFEDSLSLGRSYPIDYWVKKYQRDKKAISLRAYTMEKSKLILAREEKEEVKAIKYTVFVEANRLFDQAYLDLLKKNLVSLLSREAKERIIQIQLPQEMDFQLENQEIRKVGWYRKIIH